MHKIIPFSPYYVGKKIEPEAEKKGFATEPPYVLVEVVETNSKLLEDKAIMHGDVLAIHSVDKGIPIEDNPELFIFKETAIIFKLRASC